MKTITGLADISTLSGASMEKVSTSRGRTYALLDAAFQHEHVEWQANGRTVALLYVGAGDYCVTVDGKRIDAGTIGDLVQTVRRISAATVDSATMEALCTSRGRALIAFEEAAGPDAVLVRANGTTVIITCDATAHYRMTVNDEETDRRPIRATLEKLKGLVAGLELPLLQPTPTARDYTAWYGFWVDIQDGKLVHYVTYADGSWDEEPMGVEYACPHMIARVNTDFGTAFTMEDFEEGDCNCEV